MEESPARRKFSSGVQAVFPLRISGKSFKSRVKSAGGLLQIRRSEALDLAPIEM